MSVPRMFVLDVPENGPIVDVARLQDGVSIGRIGPYFVLSAELSIDVNRRATGVRHAVWYSWIGGLDGWKVEQWDGHGLRLVPR